MNNLKVAMLIGLLTGILIAAGYALGRTSGMMIAFAVALALNFGSYWFSDRIVLAMYRAREVTPQQAPVLHRAVNDIAMAAQIPKPRVCIVPNQSPNAFATGRNPAHAVVAVTEGMLGIMNEYELRGVLAHEIGHIKNHDTLIQCMAAAIAGAITMLASIVRWGLIFGGRGDDDDSSPLVLLAMIILAPLAAMLVQLAISRTREYQADAASARFTHNPHALATALEKLASATERIPMHANPATSHLFIVNPLRGGMVATLFSTHPPIGERINRLNSMRDY